MTQVSGEEFGALPDGGRVRRFLLRSDSVSLRVQSFGAIVTGLETKDRRGQTADIILGFDTLEGYINKHPYFGAVIGRVANRIAKGKFSIDGKDYQLPINNGPNSIHGGLKGFDKHSGLEMPDTAKNGNETISLLQQVRTYKELEGINNQFEC